jgi:dye decolorizing peroxidase
VQPHGSMQAGVDRPALPQTFANLLVFDLPAGARPEQTIADVGDAVSQIVAGRCAAMAAIAPADLTVTVGVGPERVAAVNPALPGAAALPAFAREAIDARCRGGDVLVQVCGSDPLAVTLASQELTRTVQARGGAPRWGQSGFRGYGPDGIGLNLVGFRDGIALPKGADLPREVWLDDPAPVAGGTIVVVRRLRIDLSGFLRLPLAEQDAAVGRRRSDGAPLSGGNVAAPLDLGAKTPDGRYLIPALAHVRRANPGAAGVGLILRRAYNYDNGPGDQGLLFIAFHRELRTFVETQRRLDEADALMDHTTATASAAFLVLPGFGPGERLGAKLFG